MLVQSNILKEVYFSSFENNYKIELAYIFGQIRNYLPIKIASFKTNFISNSKAAISSVYFQSEGVLSKLKDSDLTGEQAKVIHTNALKSLDSAIVLYNKINSIKSYLDDITIEMAEKIVDNYYEIESYIRRTAYHNKPLDKGDGFINEVASKLSQHSLYSFNEI